ncbi:MAG: DNA-binding MarR family transcriptional regulator [Planctomycetota bacterium]
MIFNGTICGLIDLFRSRVTAIYSKYISFPFWRLRPTIHAVSPPRTKSTRTSPSSLEARLRRVGTELSSTLAAILSALPGSPHRPGQLAEELGVNRAVASKILKAISKTDALEVLHDVPGPEPLRRVVRTATDRGVPERVAQRAEAAIGEFDQLIREEAGTRPALDALISSNLPGAREQLEMASKYSVFKGLTQLKGVQADLWLGAAIVKPTAEDSEKHDLTWLTAAVAMQRLRPGGTIRFSYRHRGAQESKEERDQDLPTLGVVPLDSFCVNPPARLEARAVGDTIQYTLPDDLLGPREAVDMFVVDHHPAAIRRHADPDIGRQTSFFVEPAIPVAKLVFDTILHVDAFPGTAPELVIYDIGYDGVADVNDRSRDMDRVQVQESVEILGRDMSRFSIEEVPTYSSMLLHLCERFGWKPEEFRGFRTTIAYPVHGWQVCLAFDKPNRA